MNNLFKYTKYLLILIIVACGSNSKEVDFQDLSINAVKNELLDPKSFELIEYSMDTIFLHEGARFNISNDSLSLYYQEGTLAMMTGGETYVERGIREDIAKYKRSIDSNQSLINNSPDTIVKYLSRVRYYTNSKDGMRVINWMGITFNHQGLFVSTLRLD